MKVLKFLFCLCFVAALASCENHMDINDIEKGTPSKADSVLPAQKHHIWPAEELEAYRESLPRVYQR